MEGLVNISICVVIPCYNEEQSLDILMYRKLITYYQDMAICFVNDGSTDNTASKLDLIVTGNEARIALLTLPENKGKAEAVRRGINYGNSQFNHKYIGYLDADLSTSIHEFKELSSYMSEEVNFVFGSRIRKIGSEINRSFFRFLIGRILATLISSILNLKVYDTQCGAKLFSRKLSMTLFQNPFISKWLFDVELFYHMILIYGHEEAISKMIEIPLSRWVQSEISSVQKSYGIRIWMDLYKIRTAYQRMIKMGVVRTVTQLDRYVETE